MPTCPYCIHIWIDFNVDMYIPTVFLKPSYMYYSYMCNPHVNLPLNSKWSWLKPHLVNSGRDPALYVCMCVYILYIHEWLGTDVGPGPGPGPGLWFEDLTSDQSVRVWIILHYQLCCPVPWCVHWMPHLSPISTKTMEVKTLPWGV